MSKIIELTQGYQTIVDDSDYVRLIKTGKWYAYRCRPNAIIYAVRNARKCDPPKPMTIHMHRVIMNAGVGVQVDHINRDGLDNRKINLRLCSSAENARNRKPQSGGTSKYKGICWCKQMSNWWSRITVNEKRISLGYYSLEIEAALVYDEAAMKYFGDFARLNFAPEPNILRVGT